VEFGALVALRSSASSLRLTSAELPEVFRCLWNDFGVELHFDTPEGLAPKGDIEEANGVLERRHIEDAREVDGSD